jgi:hypothetical protein
MRTFLWITCAALLCAVAQAKDRIAYIEFFGYQGIDTDAVRKALPFHEGDSQYRGIAAQAREVVKRITGRDATDVTSVCCLNDGDIAVFIGLAGRSSRPLAPNPRTALPLRVSAELTALMQAMDQAEASATEEVSPPVGYRLMKDAPARAAELRVREYALKHEEELVSVLRRSADAQQRALAADALGYGERSGDQMSALIYSARDADETVRNNATRALSEILLVDEAVRAGTPPAPFIELLHSGTWTDRNKGSAVLEALTRSRAPEVLARLKTQAWDALLEMARWRPTAWSSMPRMVLARVAGIPEDRAARLAMGEAAAFLTAIGAVQ